MNIQISKKEDYTVRIPLFPLCIVKLLYIHHYTTKVIVFVLMTCTCICIKKKKKTLFIHYKKPYNFAVFLPQTE